MKIDTPYGEFEIVKFSNFDRIDYFQVLRMIGNKDIKDIGFKLVPFEKDDSLLYHRPKQHLGRSIWRFRKK